MKEGCGGDKRLFPVKSLSRPLISEAFVVITRPICLLKSDAVVSDNVTPIKSAGDAPAPASDAKQDAPAEAKTAPLRDGKSGQNTARQNATAKKSGSSGWCGEGALCPAPPGQDGRGQGPRAEQETVCNSGAERWHSRRG